VTPAQTHLWSCRRAKVAAADVAKGPSDSWRLTIRLACGHETTQDFRYRVFWQEMTGPSGSASRNARAKADRAAVAIKAAGTSPCLACGPAT
jgi:hypothetical protein